MPEELVGNHVNFRYTPHHSSHPIFPFLAGGPLIAADSQIPVFLTRLRSEDADAAWQWFLSCYAGIIFGTIKLFSSDSDEQGDCFLFVCEKLADKGYRRLLAFKPEGKARFSTWLRAVTRNLCLDWMRSRYGRKQIFRSIVSEGELERRIFRSVFLHRLSTEQAWLQLTSSGVTIPFDEFEQRATRIQAMLTSRQLWLLSTANTQLTSLDSDREDSEAIEVQDLAHSPEEELLLRDIHNSVAKALGSLAEADRLLIRMRYSQELGLAQIAGLLGLNDAQTADRRIREALERLRQHLGLSFVKSGKRRSASV